MWGALNLINIRRNNMNTGGENKKMKIVVINKVLDIGRKIFHIVFSEFYGFQIRQTYIFFRITVC